MNNSEHRSRRKVTAYGLEVRQRGARSRDRQATKTRKLRRLLSLPGGVFLHMLYRRSVDAFDATVNSVWTLSFPFVILLLVTSIDFLSVVAVSESADSLFFDQLDLTAVDERRDDVELFKTQVLQYAYILVLFLSMLNWRDVYSYFRSWPHLILLTICLVAGGAISIVPVKVLTNSALIFIGFLSAILFSIAHANHRNYRAFYIAIFLPMLVLHVASLAVFALYDINIIDFLYSSQRYGGLAGNPNSLGATAVLGFWAAGTLLLSRSVSLMLRAIALMAVFLFVLHVLISGSGTSITTIVIVTLALFWLRILAAIKPIARQTLNITVVGLVALLLIAIMIFTTPADLYLSFTESLGKDASLTGRTELWNIAHDAIGLRPYFGWGFDSHASVMAERAFDIPFNHYHNGFLDTLVAGGAVLLMFVLYNLSQFARAFVASFRINPDVFPLIIPLLVLLFLNMSEYSLLRPNSQIWSIYVTAFVMLTFHQPGKPSSRFRSLRGSKTPRSRKRQLRWA